MPKINVYLPDELADAVREAGIPVSAVCQRSLELAVRRVNDIRAAVAGQQNLDDALGRLTSFTRKAQTAVARAVEQARAQEASAVTTAHLLGGLVSEGTNLALNVLRAVDIDPDQLGEEVSRSAQDEQPVPGGAPGVLGFSAPAAEALHLAVTEAISLDHNYVGGEHILLGLVAEPDGVGGAVLRDAGAEARGLRRAVGAAVAGYAHLRGQQATGQAPALQAAVADAVRQQLAPVVERLNAVEERLDRAGSAE
jgi:ATP-dependent Clp protease ATP-binding subunit ClpA/post-segregation antitoxin (ccd killing protein)